MLAGTGGLNFNKKEVQLFSCNDKEPYSQMIYHYKELI